MLYSLRLSISHDAMSDRPRAPESPETPMSGTYLLVLIVELLVIAGLWAFSRHFG